MQVEWPELIRTFFSEEAAFALALLILILGAIVAYSAWKWTHKTFDNTGLGDAVEGTTFERTVNRFGTSTAGIIGQLLALFVYLFTIILAFQVARVLEIEVFFAQITGLLPRLFIAIIAIIAGLILGDKAKLIVQERLRSVKLPEVAIIPELVKYSIFYIAALIALAQIGIATDALLILLGAFAFGLVFLGGIAFKDLLAASAAGIFLLLSEPYSIGDEVRIDDKRGIVQEVDMFVTRIETDGEEYIIPNNEVFRSGIIRVRG